MKADYKNWVPKSMVNGLIAGTVAALILFILFGATDMILEGTPRLICAVLFGVGTLALLFFAVWMAALHRTFDYNGKRKLAKTIIEGTADYLKIPDGGVGLDVGCGSGALTIACAKRNPGATVVGCDIWSGAYKAVFTQKRCEENAAAEGVTNVRFEEGNAIELPFPDETFDAVTAAFGIRNFQDLDRGLSEMCRVLKKGGHLSIVELTQPVGFPMRQLFKVYSHTVLPIYGRLISKDRSAYEYLTATIEAFPQGERMVEILHRAGFTEASFRRLTFGICTLYTATK